MRSEGGKCPVPRVGGGRGSRGTASRRAQEALQAAKAIAAAIGPRRYRAPGHAGAGCAMRGGAVGRHPAQGREGHRKCPAHSEAIHRGGSAGSSFFPQDLPPGGSNPRGD